MTKKHPSGLYVLFFTEMWERFGYYLMLSIFTLYLTEYFRMSTEGAVSLYGTYIGLVYLGPIFGGVLADRVLGYRRSVLWGAFLLSMGYFLLTIKTTFFLYTAIVVLMIGNGLFKPNISTLVGNLYPQGDQRRDSAFSIFYMGVNIGAFFSPFAASYLRTYYGWSVAFGAAGVGMLISLLVFFAAQKLLDAANQPSSIGAVVQMALPEDYNDRPELPSVEHKRISALVMMCFIVMFFWVAFHQNGSTLTFWARDNTDRTLGGFLKEQFNPEILQAINPLFVVSMTPLMIGIFSFLRRRGLEPTTPGKIALGMILTSVAYMVMVVASVVGGNSGRVSILWLIACYFVMTIAELCLSPMGLSMVTKLAPRRMTSMMIGVWHLATAIGNKLSGELGRYWLVWPHHKFFGFLVAGCMIFAMLLVVQMRWLTAAMPDEKRKKN